MQQYVDNGNALDAVQTVQESLLRGVANLLSHAALLEKAAGNFPAESVRLRDTAAALREASETLRVSEADVGLALTWIRRARADETESVTQGT